MYCVHYHASIWWVLSSEKDVQGGGYHTVPKGNEEFINFIADYNHTLIEKGTLNALKSMGKKFEKTFVDDYNLSKYGDMIVVNLRFLEPEINMIDAKYTVSDMIANFGGKFGIFAQLTGWSFLGILNILFFIIKLLMSMFNINK